MRSTTIKLLGPLGRIARVHSNAVRIAKRWKRTPRDKRMEIVADAGDVVLGKLIAAHHRRRQRGD
jgi:hypothetical protein